MTHPERVQHGYRGGSHSGESPIPDIAGIIDKEENRKFKLDAGSHNGIATIQEPCVLHDHRRLFSDQSGAGTNAYPFFLTTQRDVDDLSIPLKRVDKIETVDIRKTRYQIDPGFFYAFQDGPGAGLCVHFTHW